MYAVIETGGAQHKVSQGEKIVLDRMDANEGDSVTFDRVLLVNDGENPKFGSPLVENASVSAQVIEHKRGKKLIAFKMKRRKGFRKKTGFRADLTVVEIKEIKA